MLGLQYFSFEELWSPVVMFFYAALIILYFYLIGPWRERHFPAEPAATLKQKLLFLGGVLLYYLAQGGPLELLGHMIFSFHMTNMAISYLVVPPMILLGLPTFVWRAVFSKPFWQRLRPLMHPLVTLVLFNVLFSVYHVPEVHEYVMLNFTLHRVYYFVLLVAAFMMWWQIVSPVPEWTRLSGVKKMGYIFANGVLLTPACALIIFSPQPLYPMYNDPAIWVQAMGYCIPGDTGWLLEQFSGPEFFNFLPPIEDQQLGGVIMKLVQEFMYGAILAYVFTQWYKKEHGESDDELPPTPSNTTPNANPNPGTV